MTDVVDRATRSRMMSGIRGKNTTPELMIRSGLHSLGFRFRLHDRSLPGSPDLVLRKHGAVVFVHGCFWHRHECRLFKWPATRRDFWREKLQRNHDRDQDAASDLLAAGWRVGIVWECALKGQMADPERVVARLAKWLDGNRRKLEVGT